MSLQRWATPCSLYVSTCLRIFRSQIPASSGKSCEAGAGIIRYLAPLQRGSIGWTLNLDLAQLGVRSLVCSSYVCGLAFPSPTPVAHPWTLQGVLGWNLAMRRRVALRHRALPKASWSSHLTCSQFLFFHATDASQEMDEVTPVSLCRRAVRLPPLCYRRTHPPLSYRTFFV